MLQTECSSSSLQIWIRKSLQHLAPLILTLAIEFQALTITLQDNSSNRLLSSTEMDSTRKMKEREIYLEKSLSLTWATFLTVQTLKTLNLSLELSMSSQPTLTSTTWPINAQELEASSSDLEMARLRSKSSRDFNLQASRLQTSLELEDSTTITLMSPTWTGLTLTIKLRWKIILQETSWTPKLKR
jgi:hypothetical protein